MPYKNKEDKLASLKRYRATHKKETNLYRQKYRQKKKAEGKCIVCYRPTMRDDGATHCPCCQEYRNYRRQLQ